MTGPKTLAIDIGGSGIKAMVLDRAGRPLSERARLETPRPATPDAVLETIGRLVAPMGAFHRVSVGFPGVVRQGVVHTAPNLDSGWTRFALEAGLRAVLHHPVRVANDADVQGFGVVTGVGVELVVTLGTGLGSALFLDGCLVPNLELGHHPCRRGQTYEERLGAAALARVGRTRWNRRVRRALALLERTFNVDILYVGGGNAKRLEGELPSFVRVVSNDAGLLGGIALWRHRAESRER